VAVPAASRTKYMMCLSASSAALRDAKKPT
jgi:hypothetical protein